MEICITLGHTHPLGVLQYLAIESVVLFHMVEEIQWATHSATKATGLRDEPIAVKTVAPSEQHITTHTLLWWEVTILNCNLHLQRGRMTLIHLLVTFTQVGALCVTSRQSLATSQT